jgi:hypothetical protein
LLSFKQSAKHTAKKFSYDLDPIFKDFKDYEQKLKELRAESSKGKLA